MNISSGRDYLSILLVDDNADHRFLMRRDLERALVCRVSEAQSGSQALHFLEAPGVAFDAVLLDNGLPDLNGLEVLTRLRAAENFTPVILITAQGSEQVAVEALRRGASDYIVKSSGNEIVPAVVEQVIERDRLRRRAEQLEAEHIRFARLAAIGEVAAGIAHEIRNPMTVISGMATLLRDNFERLPADDLRSCARAIADNCVHLNRVLDEVLSSVSGSSERAPMLLSELVDETLSFMRFDPAFRHRLDISRDYQARGLVVANRDELKQIFINLFRNAAQAVQSAGKAQGSLRVSIRAVGDELLTCVSDDGPGIAPEAYPLLFETGFTTKNRDDGENTVVGSGLGLGICRRIAENHGGRLWAADPTPGQGATFCLALPAKNEEFGM